MKIYEMIDDESEISIGVLLYYENSREFIIELKEELDEWTAPLLFSGYVKKNIYTIPRSASHMWVSERVVPIDRQNIGSILATHKLSSYDEMKLLEIAHGRCSQDCVYIRKTDKLPVFASERVKHNVTECIVSADRYLILFFRDDSVKKTDLSHLPEDTEGIGKILANDQLLMSGKVGVGGYSVVFNDSIDIPAWLLYEKGVDLPVNPEDFYNFVCQNVLDTTQCCDMLECSRQNISYMVKKGQLNPIREDVKGNLYLKGEAVKNMW